MSKLAEFYNKIGETSGPQRSFRMDKLIRIAKRVRFNLLLDIGCGDGKFTSELAMNCEAKVVGIDISRSLASIANTHFDSIVSITEPRLPLKEETFDAVMCSEIIEHLIDPDNLLDEVRRVLKPNGFLLLTTPNLASWINRFSLLIGYQPHFTEVSLYHNVGKLYGGEASKTSEGAIAGHLRLFAPRSLEELLKIHGFSIAKCEGAGIGFNGKSILPFPLSIIDSTLSHKASLSAFLIYTCIKN